MRHLNEKLKPAFLGEAYTGFLFCNGKGLKKWN